MNPDDLAELERRIQEDLKAMASYFAEVGHHGSAIRVLGFKEYILCEIDAIRNAPQVSADPIKPPVGQKPA